MFLINDLWAVFSGYYSCTDGSLYNLDEYIRMNAVDALTQVEDGTVNAVFTHKYGVLLRESQLEDFFSLLSG